MSTSQASALDSQQFERLLALARDGDRSAQGELLESHRSFLELLAVRQLDARLSGRVDIADVVHDTYVTALGSLPQFRGSQRLEFLAWLRTVHEHVVQNLIREHIVTKKRSVNCERPLEDQPATPWALLTESTPSRNVMQAETIVRLIRALDALLPDQREAIRLRYFDQWKLEQIAERMDRSLPAVAGLLKRGLQALRIELTSQTGVAKSSSPKSPNNSATSREEPRS